MRNFSLNIRLENSQKIFRLLVLASGSGAFTAHHRNFPLTFAFFSPKLIPRTARTLGAAGK
jgi:hypothetical protein